MKRRNIFKVGLVVITAAIMAIPAVSQEWQPRRPITLIVPFPPGGGTATYGQSLAAPLSNLLGVPVTVVNKPGAGGVNGATEAAAARPDGQTFLVTTGGALVMASIFKDIPVDPFESFETVAQIGGLQASVVVPSSSPYQTLDELIADAKDNPGSLRWAHTGRGVFLHVSGQSFLNANGVEATDVPFQGGGKVRAAVVGGQVDFGIIGVHQNRGFENEMRALALIAPNPDTIQPQIPTVADLGLPYEFVNTPITMFAPKGTPEDVLATMSAHVGTVVNSDTFATDMETKGLLPAYLSGTAAEARLRELETTVRPIIESIK